MKDSLLVCIQQAKTECDSSQEIQYDSVCVKTNPQKHKTELCYCNYGQKCRFAHGRHQLVQLPVNLQLRKRKCNGYWGKGYCSYGLRCQFGHQEQKCSQKDICQIAKQYLASPTKCQTRLLQILNKQ